MYVIIFVVWTQWVQVLTPFVSRADVHDVLYKDMNTCEQAGELLIGPVEETDPSTKYVWRDVLCVKIL